MEHARRSDARLLEEARDAYRNSRRFQAHPEPPVALVRPIEILGFLVSLVVIVVGLVLVLATGTYPS